MPKRRLVLLLGGLAAVGLLYAATQKWREGLMRESARHRAVIAAVEGQQAARQSAASAAAELQARLREEPADPQARTTLAALRWGAGGPRAAMAVLAAAPRPFSDPAVPRMLAYCFREMGREDRALKLLNETIPRFPQDGGLRSERALLYVLLAWQQDAEKEIRAADKLGAPDLALTRASLARARFDLKGAQRLLEEARQADPQNLDIVRQLAAVAGDGKRYDEVISLLTTLPEGAWSPEDRLSLAAAYLRRNQAGDAEKAEPLVEDLLRLQPGHPRGRLLRFRVQQAMGHTEEARKGLERLYRDSPGTFGVAYELGELYRKEGRDKEAMVLLNEHQAAQKLRGELKQAADALRRSPSDAKAHLAMSLLCVRQGMDGRGIVELERAIALDPAVREQVPFDLLREAQTRADRNFRSPTVFEPRIIQ